MRFSLFERIDVVLHRCMRGSYRLYRRKLEQVCKMSNCPSSVDQWTMNRLYDIHVFFKKLWNGHIRKPSSKRMRFLVAMDELFTRAEILMLLFPRFRFRPAIRERNNA